MGAIRPEQIQRDRATSAYPNRRQRVFETRRCPDCGKLLLGNETERFRWPDDDRVCHRCLDRRDRRQR